LFKDRHARHDIQSAWPLWTQGEHKDSNAVRCYYTMVCAVVELIFSCVQVSALSYGSWVSFHNQLDTQNAKSLMGQCFDAGVNFFDNAGRPWMLPLFLSMCDLCTCYRLPDLLEE
jgi:hypothetical protein